MTDVPTTRHAENMAKRFRKHGAAFFTFVTTPDVDPTNNTAEQAIRFVVIDRHITQGTRSETGRRWSERIWTTIATCEELLLLVRHGTFETIPSELFQRQS